MGADGALQLALNFPDVFGVAGAHSPTLPRPGYAPAFYGDFEYYSAYDPMTLVEAYPDVARTLKLWLDVGADDPRLVNATTFHQLMNQLGIAHEWHVLPGEHHTKYWNDHLGAYLLFYNAALNERA
jgi:S-formylglutathione hydrolase FrmB